MMEKNAHTYQDKIIASEARRARRAKSRFANARELLYRYIGKQNN